MNLTTRTCRVVSYRLLVLHLFGASNRFSIAECYLSYQGAIQRYLEAIESYVGAAKRIGVVKGDSLTSSLFEAKGPGNGIRFDSRYCCIHSNLMINACFCQDFLIAGFHVTGRLADFPQFERQCWQGCHKSYTQIPRNPCSRGMGGVSSSPDKEYWGKIATKQLRVGISP